MTHARHIPIRSCAVCRTRSPKPELLRFRRGADGWRIDPRGRGGGRGTWVCRTCAETRDPKAFRRAFRGDADAVLQQLERLMRHASTDAPTDDSAPTDRIDAPPTAPNAERPTAPEDPRHGGMHG